MCIRIIRMAVSKKVSNAAFAHAPICSKTQTKMQESAITVGANGGCLNFQGPKSHKRGMVTDKPDVSCEYSNIGSLARKLKLGPIISPSFNFLFTKIHQNRFRLGLCPRPYRGLTVLTMLPVPLTVGGEELAGNSSPPTVRGMGSTVSIASPL